MARGALTPFAPLLLRALFVVAADRDAAVMEGCLILDSLLKDIVPASTLDPRRDPEP